MAKVEIYWTEQAFREVEAIGHHLAGDSPARAIEFIDRLFESASPLEKFPLSGATCTEDASCRQLGVAGYRVIYESTARGVEILTGVSPGPNRDRLK